MTRRCSHCSHNGHNSRTCPTRGLMIFGVRLTDSSIRKSASTGNLTHYAGCSGGRSPADAPELGGGPDDDGYASEGFVKGSKSSCRERKKGVIWTEGEHRMFLLGLKELGKGDWQGIARNFVVSRTPTQVASHAQKYFIRLANANRRRRRSSLFDMPIDANHLPMGCQEPEAQNRSSQSAPPSQDAAPPSVDSNSIEGNVAGLPKPEPVQYIYPYILPFPPFFPCSYPILPGCVTYTTERKQHEVVKPTAVHSNSHINVDELVGISNLNLVERIGGSSASSLCVNLPRVSDRQSAFHANQPTGHSRIGSSSNPIHEVY